jgi:uncharacterized repeat protein (TIGR01451 family)
MTSIVGWAVIGFVALAFSGSDAFGLDPKPDVGVIVTGAGADMRPITAPGQPFLFMIGLDNMKGVADAHHVKLSAVLPNGLKFQSSEPPPTRVESGNRPVWEIDTLPAKASPRLFQVTAETDTNLAPGSQLEISAAVESSESNLNSADNHAKYTIYVQKVGPALVFLGSTLDSVLLTAESPATFKINVKNAGNLPSTGTRLEATLPKGVKFDKADLKPAFSSGQAVTFKLGDLARAESKSVSMTVAFDSRQLPDLLSNDRPLTFAFRLSRMASGAEVTDSRFKVAKHIESAGQDVAVWLMAEDAKEPGETSPKNDVTCVIKFANLGNQSAHKVVVALYLGSGLAIAHSDSQPTSTGANDAFPGGVAHWDVGDLGVGMSRTIRSVINAKSIPDDGALVTTTITADGIDLDTSNNTASLLRRSQLPPDTLKSLQRSAAVVKPVGVSEKTTVRPVSHRWRHFFELILVTVAVVIFFRARRKS